MKKNNFNPMVFAKQSFLSLIVLSSLGLFLSCGASRQSSEADSIDIDELLGEEEYIQEEQTNSDEAEVLKLLGITPVEEKSDIQNTDYSFSESSVSNSEQMEGDLAMLKDDLVKKEGEISQLRSELTQKEIQISELESRESMTTTTTVARTNGPVTQPSAVFKAKYQKALSSFKGRKYQVAVSMFSELINSDPNNLLSDNCQYWIGESYFGMLNYNQAIAEFEKVFSFSNSNKNDDAQLKLGVCNIKLGDLAQARAEFDRLLAVYPNSEYTNIAQKYISKL